MIIDATIVFFVLALLLQSVLSSFKKFYWGLILPIISAIIFIYTLDGWYYESLNFEVIIFIIARAVMAIVRAINGKKKVEEKEKSKIAEIDKSIIKDL